MLAAPALVLLDSVTHVRPEHAGRLVVTGSHGGISVLQFARGVRAWLYVFNDAGVGKDEAGVAVLAPLGDAGIAAAAVAHDSARIGEARDTWEHGRITRVNAPAVALGLAPGQPLAAVLAPAAQ